MKKKAYKQFHQGKGIAKTSSGHKPMQWISSSYLDTYNAETGKFRSRRKFGSDGWAHKDMDVADHHKPYDHVHDIHRGKRFEDRKPNKQEKKEFQKAKKKRRFL